MVNNILVVDDVALNVRMLEDILGKEYHVLTAESGEEALKILEDETPDVMLLDNMMKGMSGFDVLDIMQKDVRMRQIPVIYLSSNDDADTETESLKRGCVDFIQRPFKASCTLQRVKMQIELAQYRKSLQDMVRRKTEQIQKIEDSFVRCMARLIEYKDNNGEESSHTDRTTLYAEALAEELKYDTEYESHITDKFMEDLKRAVPLHDIHRIGNGDTGLSDTETLSTEELLRMDKRVEAGESILDELMEYAVSKDYLLMARQMASSHYERYDGSGYPKGLKGQSIPLAGRIMQIADVYDALRFGKADGSRVSHEEACRFIFDRSGTQFDPVLVDTFKGMNIHFDDIALDNEEEVL